MKLRRRPYEITPNEAPKTSFEGSSESEDDNGSERSLHDRQTSRATLQKTIVQKVGNPGEAKAPFLECERRSSALKVGSVYGANRSRGVNQRDRRKGRKLAKAERGKGGDRENSDCGPESVQHAGAPGRSQVGFQNVDGDDRSESAADSGSESVQQAGAPGKSRLETQSVDVDDRSESAAESEWRDGGAQSLSGREDSTDDEPHAGEESSAFESYVSDTDSDEGQDTGKEDRGGDDVQVWDRRKRRRQELEEPEVSSEDDDSDSDAGKDDQTQDNESASSGSASDVSQPRERSSAGQQDPWVRIAMHAECTFPDCVFRVKDTKIARIAHFHSTCRHRHVKGPKRGMLFHDRSIVKMREHHIRCLKSARDGSEEDFKQLKPDLWIARRKGEECPSTECVYKEEGSNLSKRHHYHATCGHRHAEGTPKSGMIIHYKGKHDALDHQRNNHSTEEELRRWKNIRERKVEEKLKGPMGPREPYDFQKFGLSKDLWVERKRGETCLAEDCIYRDGFTGKSLRRHCHAACDHRHLRSRRKGMLIHYYSPYSMLKHQRRHKGHTASHKPRKKLGGGGKRKSRKPRRASEPKPPATQLQQTHQTLVLGGGTDEAELDDLDFTVEAAPMDGCTDPGPGLSDDPWCRWLVKTVGFHPPRGRPGKAQLAGLAPGDEVALLPSPREVKHIPHRSKTAHDLDPVMIEAGRVGGDLMGQVLRHIASRPLRRKDSIVRSARDGKDGDSELTDKDRQGERESAGGGRDAPLHVRDDEKPAKYDRSTKQEWLRSYRWRIEFRRPLRSGGPGVASALPRRLGCEAVGCVQAGPSALASEEAAGVSPRPRPGRRRPRPLPRNASLSFRVFREGRWAPDGGRLFSVRVEEAAEKDVVPPAPPVPSGLPSRTADPIRDALDNHAGASGTRLDIKEEDEEGDTLSLLGLSETALSALRRRVGLSPIFPTAAPQRPPPPYPQSTPSAKSLDRASERSQEEEVSRSPVDAWGAAFSPPADNTGERIRDRTKSVGPRESHHRTTHLATMRDGEERVKLDLSPESNLDVCFEHGDDRGGFVSGENYRHGHCLLDYLTPAAVELVKERIFAAARLEYARLYGLRRGWQHQLHQQQQQRLPSRVNQAVTGVESSSGTTVVDMAVSTAATKPSGDLELTQCVDNADELRGSEKGSELPESWANGGADVSSGSSTSVDGEEHARVEVRSARGSGQEEKQLDCDIPLQKGAPEVSRERGQSNQPPEATEKRRQDVKIVDETAPQNNSSAQQPETAPRPGSGVLSRTLQDMIQTLAFREWVAGLRRWSVLQPTSRSCVAAATGGWTEEACMGRYIDSEGKAAREPFEFFVGWQQTTKSDGVAGANRHVGVFRTFTAEAAKIPGLQQVSIPAFPVHSKDNDQGTTNPAGAENEDLRFAVTTAAARLFPRWDSQQKQQNDLDVATEDTPTLHGTSTAAGDNRGAVGGSTPTMTSTPFRELRQGRSGQSGNAHGTRAEGESAGGGVAAGNQNQHKDTDNPQESVVGAGEGVSQDAGKGDGRPDCDTEPTPVHHDDLQASANLNEEDDSATMPLSTTLQPPPPPAGEFSAAVNKLLRGVLFVPLGAGKPAVTRLTAEEFKVFKKTRSWRRAKGNADQEPSTTCFVCRLPVVSGCVCGALELARERAFWHEEVAEASGKTSQIHLAEKYSGRVNSWLPESFIDGVATHRMTRVFPNRLDQNVSLQHRGSLALPLTSTITRTSRDGKDFTRNSNETTVHKLSSDQHQECRQEVAPVAGSETTSLSDRGAGTSSINPSPTAEEAQSKMDRAGHEQGSTNGSKPSVSPPRLKEWPGFPKPSQVFARAAPVEAPTGLLPPSRRFLGYIHQVASMKVKDAPELHGAMDESALIAVGILVEEMLEELVSPLVDGRTRGYKYLTSESLKRELAFYQRMSPHGTGPQHGNISDSGLLSAIGLQNKHRRTSSTTAQQTSLGNSAKDYGTVEDALNSDQSSGLGEALQRVFGLNCPSTGTSTNSESSRRGQARSGQRADADRAARDKLLGSAQYMLDLHRKRFGGAEVKETADKRDGSAHEGGRSETRQLPGSAGSDCRFGKERGENPEGRFTLSAEEENELLLGGVTKRPRFGGEKPSWSGNGLTEVDISNDEDDSDSGNEDRSVGQQGKLSSDYSDSDSDSDSDSASPSDSDQGVGDVGSSEDGGEEDVNSEDNMVKAMSNRQRESGARGNGWLEMKNLPGASRSDKRMRAVDKGGSSRQRKRRAVDKEQRRAVTKRSRKSKDTLKKSRRSSPDTVSSGEDDYDIEEDSQGRGRVSRENSDKGKQMREAQVLRIQLRQRRRLETPEDQGGGGVDSASDDGKDEHEEGLTEESEEWQGESDSQSGQESDS